MKDLYDRLKFLSGQYLRNHPWDPQWVLLPAQGSPKPCGYPDNASLVPTDGPTENCLVPTEDFQGLQAEVKAWASALENGSATLCGQLLGGLGQVLRDEPALQALEESVSRPHGGGGWGATGSVPANQAHCLPVSLAGTGPVLRAGGASARSGGRCPRVPGAPLQDAGRGVGQARLLPAGSAGW